MALCPVCGCKTDELDFVTDNIAGTEVKMCSFCQRQLGAFGDDKEPGEGHIRWLSSVSGKVVAERPEVVSKYLFELSDKFSDTEVADSVVQPYTPAYTPTPIKMAGTVDYNQSELLERIEALEKQMKAFKKSILIKSILEVCVPIILALILLLVFVSSDLFDSLSKLYGFFV
jgi:hypothetical protein